MTIAPIPTPDHLDRAPELATLAVLATTLQVAVFAVIAEQPGLRGPDHASSGPLADSHWVATVLVALGNKLLVVISAYRDALDREPRPPPPARRLPLLTPSRACAIPATLAMDITRRERNPIAGRAR
jgi:hypothetical protein